MTISGIYAISTNTIFTSENIFSTDSVNIDLIEYMKKNDNSEVLYDGKKRIVFPGNNVSLIPKVINLGANCYIRAKVTFEADKDVFEDNNNYIFDISDKWKKYGDYYYYSDVVNTGEKIEIFNNVKIPTNLPEKYSGKNIIVTVSADAIQSDNFNPNYSLADPWYGEKVAKSVSNTYGVDLKDKNFNVEPKFENDAEKYIEISKNFFGNLNKIVPGDEYTENVKLTNKTDKETEYFYGIEIPENLGDNEKSLLEKVQLVVIKNDTETIYSDILLNHKNNSIGKLKPNEEANIKFILKIPKELDNNFSMLNVKFSWKFSVQPEENLIEKIVKEVVNTPKTGDLKFDLSLSLFFISAIVLIIVLFLEYRMKRTQS